MYYFSYKRSVKFYYFTEINSGNEFIVSFQELRNSISLGFIILSQEINLVKALMLKELVNNYANSLIWFFFRFIQCPPQIPSFLAIVHTLPNLIVTNNMNSSQSDLYLLSSGLSHQKKVILLICIVYLYTIIIPTTIARHR